MNSFGSCAVLNVMSEKQNYYTHNLVYSFIEFNDCKYNFFLSFVAHNLLNVYFGWVRSLT